MGSEPSFNIDDPAERFDLNRVLAKFRRYDRLFAMVALAIMAAVVLLTFQQAPHYTAAANVMIDLRKRDVSDIQDVLSGLPQDTSVVDSEVEVLKSRSLAEHVVTDLNLDQDPEFNSRLRSGPDMMSMLKWPFAAAAGLFSHAQPLSAAAQAASAHEAVVDSVLGHLKVRRVGTTYVISVGFESKDAAKAATIANAFAENYLTRQLQDKYDATRQANQWLNERLAELEPQVAQTEAAVEQYKAQHGLLASVGSSLTEQEISNLDSQLAQAQADQAERDSRLRTAQQQLATGGTGENFTGALTSDTVKELRSQKATISAHVADLQTKYGPRHPEVQRAQRQLADIDSQIQQEVARIVGSLQNEDQIARGRTASIEASLARTKGTLIGDNEASVELDQLQRKANAESTLYDSLLNRAKQTSTDQGAEQPDARIVSHAKTPAKPSSPNKPIDVALGLLLALGGGGAAILIAEALDNRLTTSEDVERQLGMPHIGSIPTLGSTIDGRGPKLQPARYVVEKPLSAFAEAFRNLRTSILFSGAGAPVQVILVTSSLPGEGKTTTTCCLGRSMAMSGSKVVVVDCDLRRRNLNRLLDIEPTAGLVEVLQGLATLDEALAFDAPSGAYFLPLSSSVHTPKDLFGSEAMDRLIASLRERFELILIDTPPVIAISDTRVLAPKADAVMFLAQWRKTPLKAIEVALRLMKSVGANVVGVALTRVDARQQARYGYGDAGYYYNAYKKYYAQ
jgi:exopolysaccharide transport family protein